MKKRLYLSLASKCLTFLARCLTANLSHITFEDIDDEIISITILPSVDPLKVVVILWQNYAHLLLVDLSLSRDRVTELDTT